MCSSGLKFRIIIFCFKCRLEVRESPLSPCEIAKRLIEYLDSRGKMAKASRGFFELVLCLNSTVPDMRPEGLEIS